MKEEELIKLGMQRTDVSAEESGAEEYHYYWWDPYEQSSIGLITSASDDDCVVKRGDWKVYLFDDPDIEILKAEDVQILMDVLSRNISHHKKGSRKNET